MLPEEWRKFATGQFREHPVFRVLCEDPSSGYAFRKPRGYAGDAVLLDLLYGGGSGLPLVEGASPTGRELYRQTSQLPTTLAVRHRRDYLGTRLLQLCQGGERTRVLSVACGHLREASALASCGLWPERLVALDQDEQSLAEVEATYGADRVECIKSSAFRLLSPRFDIGKFDFIYSAGLTDYLDDSFTARLIGALAARLAPGGTLLMCNMLPETWGRGYMEAVMDWWLIYRTEAEMNRLAETAGLPARVFRSEDGHVVYLEVQRSRQ
jgi:SAM-dependent methyltransferase